MRRPPLEPPTIPRRRGEVILRVMRSSADGGEVVIDALAVGFEAGLVPGGAELAAAADVGEDVDAAVLEPELAEGAGVGGRVGDLEAAVCGEERGVGAVVLEVFAVDDEVGDLGAVFGGGVELLDDVAWRRRTGAAWILRA